MTDLGSAGAKIRCKPPIPDSAGRATLRADSQRAIRAGKTTLHCESSALVEKVRHATARFVDIDVALAEGWIPATPCVSGPDTGAMGVHLVFPSRLDHVVLDASQPQALIYEPTPNGAMRLVGVEFIVKASVWAVHNPPLAVPALEGNLLNSIGEPNRCGLPALRPPAAEHNRWGSTALRLRYVAPSYHKPGKPGVVTPMAEPLGVSRIIT